MPYEVKRVGTYYTVRDKETGKKHSEHATQIKAENTVAYLEDIETGALPKPVSSKTRKYKSAGMFGSVTNSTGR